MSIIFLQYKFIMIREVLIIKKNCNDTRVNNYFKNTNLICNDMRNIIKL